MSSKLKKLFKPVKDNSDTVIKNSVNVSAGGKVIISGEHSVVYGYKALVGAIDLNISATVKTVNFSQNDDQYLKFILNLLSDNWQINLPYLEFTFKTTLPQKSGLGSSAAYAKTVILAVSNLLNKKIPKDQLFKLVWEAENFIHTNSSGVDPAIIVYRGLMEFYRTDNKIVKKQLNSNKLVDLTFFLVDSGQATESTGEMVNLVAKKIHKNQNYKKILEEMGKVTDQIIQLTKNGEFSQELIILNQNLLEKLGVVGEPAKKIIKQITTSGGAAKITGAGGIKNGSGQILVYHQNPQFFINLAKKNDWSIKPITIGTKN